MRFDCFVVGAVLAVGFLEYLENRLLLLKKDTSRGFFAMRIPDAPAYGRRGRLLVRRGVNEAASKSGHGA